MNIALIIVVWGKKKNLAIVDSILLIIIVCFSIKDNYLTMKTFPFLYLNWDKEWSIDIESVSTNWDLQDLTEDIDAIINITEEIASFMQTQYSCSSINGFAGFKARIDNEIWKFFHFELDWESELFKEAFLYSDQGHFQWSEEKQGKLQSLIIKKQSLYYHFISEAIKTGYLDKVLTEFDTITLTSILDSGILQYFNRLYIESQNLLKATENQNYKPLDLKKNEYGCIKDGELIPYNQVLDLDSFIRPDFFKKIINENLRKYFIWLYELLQSGNTDHESWLEIEKYALQSWEDKNSNIGFVTLMEDYNLPWVIDPELLFYIIEPDIGNKNNAIELAKKTFWWKDYGIANTKTFNAEDILSWWDWAFSVSLGKNFPNEQSLKDEMWTFAYAKESKLWEALLAKNATDCNKLIDVSSIDQEAFTEHTLKHVYYHEYWHNLFLWNPHNSMLEETKPDLFAYLRIYDECVNKTPDKKYIKDTLDFLTVSFIRKNKFEGKDDLKKYCIAQRLIFQELRDTGLVSWDTNDRISYNVDIDIFMQFLENLKSHLFFIKDLYETEDDAWRQKTENSFISKLEKDTNEDFDKIANILKSEK